METTQVIETLERLAELGGYLAISIESSGVTVRAKAGEFGASCYCPNREPIVLGIVGAVQLLEKFRADGKEDPGVLSIVGDPWRAYLDLDLEEVYRNAGRRLGERMSREYNERLLAALDVELGGA